MADAPQEVEVEAPRDDARPEVSALVDAVIEYQSAAWRLRAAARNVGPESMALADLLLTMIDVRDATNAAHDAKATLGEVANDLMPSRSFTLPGVGNFSAYSGFTRKWHDEDLLDRMLRLARESRRPDPETGEVESPEARLAALVRECAAFSYWKVKALKKHGVEAGEYAEWRPGRRGVSLPRAPIDDEEE